MITLKKPKKAAPSHPPFASPTAARIGKVITDSIASDPYHVAGSNWCRLSHLERAEKLGICERTVSRIIGTPPGNAPFVSMRRLVDGVQTTLVRVGEPTDEDRWREVAIILVRIWREYLANHIPARQAELNARVEKLSAKLKMATSEEKAEIAARLKMAKKHLDSLHPIRETKKEFGLFVGLAKDWPNGLQMQLLMLALTEFSRFMVGVKVAEAAEGVAFAAKNPKNPLDALFLKFPHISTIRRFSGVAIEMMEDDYQEKGDIPPLALRAVHPWRWSHLKG
jgi:hypothetical protein